MNIEVCSGGIDIRSVDPVECFRLGQVYEELRSAESEVLTGPWGQGLYIRLPIIDKGKV